MPPLFLLLLAAAPVHLSEVFEWEAEERATKLVALQRVASPTVSDFAARVCRAFRDDDEGGLRELLIELIERATQDDAEADDILLAQVQRLAFSEAQLARIAIAAERRLETRRRDAVVWLLLFYARFGVPGTAFERVAEESPRQEEMLRLLQQCVANASDTRRCEVLHGNIAFFFGLPRCSGDALRPDLQWIVGGQPAALGDKVVAVRALNFHPSLVLVQLRDGAPAPDEISLRPFATPGPTDLVVMRQGKQIAMGDPPQGGPSVIVWTTEKSGRAAVGLFCKKLTLPKVAPELRLRRRAR